VDGWTNRLKAAAQLPQSIALEMLAARLPACGTSDSTNVIRGR
jgi:hypothetical protein